MEIGKKILELRKKNNLSQENLAEKIGVARQTISKWELGETNPDLKQTKKLANIFNISLDELVNNKLKEIPTTQVNSYKTKHKNWIKIIKLIGITLIIILITFFILYIGSLIQKNQNKKRIIKHSSITCRLHNEEYFFEFIFYEDNGHIIEASGDAYLAHITEIQNYSDAYQAINIIDAYVKNNGGTTIIKEEYS